MSSLVETVRDSAGWIKSHRGLPTSVKPRSGQQLTSTFPVFWAVITAASGAAPPYDYEWSAIGPTGATLDGDSGLFGYLFNLGEQPGRLDPDGSSADITYPAIPADTVVLVVNTFPLFTGANEPWSGASAYAGRYCFDATLQPARSSCPSGGESVALDDNPEGSI